MNDEDETYFFNALYWDMPTMSETQEIIQAIYGRGFADGVAFEQGGAA